MVQMGDDAAAGIGIVTAQAIMASVVKAGASRHVASSFASALWRLIVGADDLAAAASPLLPQQEVLSVVEQAPGPQVGMREVKRILKQKGYEDLAAAARLVQAQRKLAAHHVADILKRLRCALLSEGSSSGSSEAADGCRAWFEEQPAAEPVEAQLDPQGVPMKDIPLPQVPVVLLHEADQVSLDELHESGKQEPVVHSQEAGKQVKARRTKLKCWADEVDTLSNSEVQESECNATEEVEPVPQEQLQEVVKQATAVQPALDKSVKPAAIVGKNGKMQCQKVVEKIVEVPQEQSSQPVAGAERSHDEAKAGQATARQVQKLATCGKGKGECSFVQLQEEDTCGKGKG